MAESDVGIPRVKVQLTAVQNARVAAITLQSKTVGVTEADIEELKTLKIEARKIK